MLPLRGRTDEALPPHCMEEGQRRIVRCVEVAVEVRPLIEAHTLAAVQWQRQQSCSLAVTAAEEGNDNTPAVEVVVVGVDTCMVEDADWMGAEHTSSVVVDSDGVRSVDVEVPAPSLVMVTVAAAVVVVVAVVGVHRSLAASVEVERSVRIEEGAAAAVGMQHWY